MTDTKDNLVLGVDRALRTLTGLHQPARETPAEGVEESDLQDGERAHAAGLMRVNHTGEICAQALYEGQALAARSDEAREALLQSAREERDHLAWCRERLTQLDAKPSLLDPLFYGASYLMGALTGLAGDKVSLGFVEATEDQVVEHLDRHMAALPEEDLKSRAIVAQMRTDEAEHGARALAMGGKPFPRPIKTLMTFASRVMTETTYRI